jgi:quercetin dioxygenase-like cupin family protein
MAPGDESQLRRELEREGFFHSFVWWDAPGKIYPDHTHAGVTAHIILEGEITLTTKGESHTYHTGERCDIPAGAVHSARIGPHGCRYLIAEK